MTEKVKQGIARRHRITAIVRQMHGLFRRDLLAQRFNFLTFPVLQEPFSRKSGRKSPCFRAENKEPAAGIEQHLAQTTNTNPVYAQWDASGALAAQSGNNQLSKIGDRKVLLTENIRRFFERLKTGFPGEGNQEGTVALALTV